MPPHVQMTRYFAAVELVSTKVCLLVVSWTQEGRRLNAGEESGMERDICPVWRRTRCCGYESELSSLESELDSLVEVSGA